MVVLDVDPGERAGQTTSLLVAVAPRRPRVHEHTVHVLDAALAQGLLKLGALLAGSLALVELLEHYGRLDVRDVRPRGNGALGQRDHGLVGRPVVPVEDDREGFALEGVSVLEGEYVLLGWLVQGEAGEAVPRAEVAFLAHYADSFPYLLKRQRRQGMIGHSGLAFCHSHDLLLSRGAKGPSDATRSLPSSLSICLATSQNGERIFKPSKPFSHKSLLAADHPLVQGPWPPAERLRSRPPPCTGR